jgi:hypothetical protein
MKITKTQLRQIIKEELERALNERTRFDAYRAITNPESVKLIKQGLRQYELEELKAMVKMLELAWRNNEWWKRNRKGEGFTLAKMRDTDPNQPVMDNVKAPVNPVGRELSLEPYEVGIEQWAAMKEYVEDVIFEKKAQGALGQAQGDIKRYGGKETPDLPTQALKGLTQ